MGWVGWTGCWIFGTGWVGWTDWVGTGCWLITTGWVGWLIIVCWEGWMGFWLIGTGWLGWTSCWLFEGWLTKFVCWLVWSTCWFELGLLCWTITCCWGWELPWTTVWELDPVEVIVWLVCWVFTPEFPEGAFVEVGVVVELCPWVVVVWMLEDFWLTAVWVWRRASFLSPK